MDAPSLTPWKDRIRQERIRRNWRQQDLADQLDTTVVTIQRWERGAQLPGVYFRAKLCTLFGKSAEELGLLPGADSQDDESPLAPAEMSLTDRDRSCLEDIPEASDTVEAPSIAAASSSTSTQQQVQPARSSFLTRRRLLVGLAGGTLMGVAGGLLEFFHLRTSPPTLGKALYIYYGHTGMVRAITWSPEGQWIASAGDDGTVQVWVPYPGVDRALLTYQQDQSTVFAVAWSPDGRQIASAGLDVQVWNAFSGHRSLLYRGHRAKVKAVAWSPDGRYLASGSADHTVQVWDALNGKLFFKLEHRAEVTGVSWAPDGQLLASSSTDHEIQVSNVYTGKSWQTYPKHWRSVEAVAWSPNSLYLASGGEDQTLQVKHLKRTMCWRAQQTRTVWAVAWGPGSKQVAAADGGGTVQVLEVPGAHLQMSYTGHRGEVRAVAWSPDGTQIASGGQDRMVHVWRAI